MTKTEIIDKLFDQVSNNMNTFMTMLGIFLTLTLLLFGIFQWRFTTNQIEKMKQEIKKEVYEENKLDRIDNLENEVKELHANYTKIIKGRALLLQVQILDFIKKANEDINNENFLKEDIRTLNILFALSKGEIVEYSWLLSQLGDFYNKVKDKHKQHFSDQVCDLLLNLFVTILSLSSDSSNKKYMPNFKAFMDISKFIKDDNW